MSKHFICIDTRDEKPFSLKAKDFYEVRDMLIVANLGINPEWDEFESEWVFSQFNGPFPSAKAANEYMSSTKFLKDLESHKDIRASL